MKIKLRFSTDRSIRSIIINIFTLSRYSHVDYMFTDKLGYSAFPNPDGGVRYSSYIPYKYEYREMEVNDKKVIEDFLLAQHGKKYDWKAIFGIAFFLRDWHRPTAWFCSELIAAAIEQDTKLFSKPHHRITPADLLKHPMIKKVS